MTRALRASQRVAVLGQGYVGLPLAITAVSRGHRVIGFDTDAERIKMLQSAQSFTADITDQEIALALATGRYTPTATADDLAGFDVAAIAVPTPLHDGTPDLSHIQHAAELLGPHVRPGNTVVLESTTYPGTTEEILRPALEAASGLSAGVHFHLGYSPERIDPGNPTWHLSNTPKIISGIDEASLAAVRAFYATLVDSVVEVAAPRDAELAKLLENTFRHVNIALVNELAVYARHLGADIWAALDAAQTKPFGFMRFSPGPGVGGHCLPVDPAFLAWHVRRRVGRTLRFVDLANDINATMPEYVVQRLSDALNRRGLAVNGARILLLGLAYKPNTGDTRDAPALAVAGHLIDLGAKVSYADPHVHATGILDPRMQPTDLTEEAIAEADVTVLITDHNAFDLEFVERHAPFIFDCRARLTGSNVERL